MPKASRFSVVLTLALTLCAHADEGMWVYNNLPLKQLQAKYGFTPSPQWIERLMKASVRFNNGGSGSFISANGLVLTNHHVAADALEKLSTPEHNLYEEGFLARTPADEKPTKDLELNQLISIEDVTSRVNAAVKPEMSVAEAIAARRAAIAAIEKEGTEATGLRCDVVTLYQGGQYHLYRYKKYTDVRLVFAPEFAAAFFGGDPDNFEFPRYDLDMCIFRVYENGKPVQVDNFFKWSAAGPAEGELIFVSGHPGRTSRMFTAEALKHLRDFQVPYTLGLLRRREIMLQQYSMKSEENARRAKEELFGVQNSRKVYLGQMSSLQEGKIITAKQRADYQLRAKVAADPKLQELAGAWDRVAQAQARAKELAVRRALLEAGQAFNTPLFTIARHLVRMAYEDRKPDSERLAEYRAARRASLLLQLYSDAPIYGDLEKAKLTDSLSFLVEVFGAGDGLVNAVLRGKGPDARAAALVDGTDLADPRVRQLIAAGGVAEIESSEDPMIRLARLVDDPARAIRKQFEEGIEEPERQAYGQISKALFAVYGTSVYPDATFTLRLAYGQVKGYSEGSGPIAPMTTLGGAFEHEKAHGGKDPWKLPESWRRAKDKLKLETPYNFVSTADIIGGNSGSPVVNAKGELVGLIFDGNIHSLTANFHYTDEKSRAVSVHSAGMLEALRAVYGADALVRELTEGALAGGDACPGKLAGK